MLEEFIDDFNDPRLTPYRNLKRTAGERDTIRLVAEGWLVVERLLGSRFDVESVLVDRRYLQRARLIVKSSTALYVTRAELINQLVGFPFHAGVMACARRERLPSVESLTLTNTSTILVCPRTSDPENLGSLIRLAAGFQADGLILGRQCADPFSRRALRVSMGNALRLPMYESVDLVDDLLRLRRQYQVDVMATVLDPAATPLHQSRHPGRLALLFGNEGSGLEEAILRCCSSRITIPMSPEVDSLNVAHAAAIVLYHFLQAGGAVAIGCDSKHPD